MAAPRTKAIPKAGTASPRREALVRKTRTTAPPDGDDLASAEGVSRRLARLGCDPIAIMAEIASDAAADPRLRLAAAKELAAYLMSKPRGPATPPPPAVDVAAIIARGWSDPDADAEGGAAPADSRP